MPHDVLPQSPLEGHAPADAPEQVMSCSSHRLFVLAQIADKWSVMILAALCAGPQRFNELRRSLGGITQKSLTQTLRRLERNGIVSRHVLGGSPVAVAYEITPLGVSLKEPIAALYQWTAQNLTAVRAAQEAFDARAFGSGGDDEMV